MSGANIQSKDITDVSGIPQMYQNQLRLVWDTIDIMDTRCIRDTRYIYERPLMSEGHHKRVRTLDTGQKHLSFVADNKAMSGTQETCMGHQ